MKTRLLILFVIGIIGFSVILIENAFAEEEILILLENDVRKVYYSGENIISVLADPELASVIFETGENTKLKIKAPQVYKKGPGLFILKNGEEIAPEIRTDNCFYYTTIETQVPEKIEIIFAFWPEYPETLKGCETFTVSPLKQSRLGISVNEIQCRDDLVLIPKYDGSPACVKPETIQKLIDRNWTTQSIVHDIIFKTMSKNLGPECEQTTMDDILSGIVDEKCSKFIDELVDEQQSEMIQRGYSFDQEKKSWVKDGYPDIMMSIADYYQQNLKIVESEPEPSDGVFYQRYHISIYQNTKTMEQYVTPDFITIGTNSQVTWSNYDDVPISLNSIDPDNPWSTTVISPDGYDTLTFDETGIYEYRGSPEIHGFIIVMDDDGELLSSKFSHVFGHTSPLMYTEGGGAVLLYDNCKRYAYWLSEQGKEKIDLYEDYPRYPPWGNQIFPLVDFCVTNGDLVKTISGDHYRWEFQLENEN